MVGGLVLGGGSVLFWTGGLLEEVYTEFLRAAVDTGRDRGEDVS